MNNYTTKIFIRKHLVLNKVRGIDNKEHAYDLYLEWCVHIQNYMQYFLFIGVYDYGCGLPIMLLVCSTKCLHLILVWWSWIFHNNVANSYPMPSHILEIISTNMGQVIWATKLKFLILDQIYDYFISWIPKKII